MFNAEEIIELEKKWFKYKVKQKGILYLFLILCLSAISILVLYLIPQYMIEKKESKLIVKKPISKKIPIKTIVKKMLIIEANKTLEMNTSLSKEKTIVKTDLANNKTIEKILEINATLTDNNSSIKKEPVKHKASYLVFKLIPSTQANELFSSSASLTLKVFKEKTTPKKIISNETTNNLEETSKKEKAKQHITINTHKIDTLKYLKEKFYSTSNIIFPLMLAEEYYNKSDYENSIKWALTANDIDSQNDKSWYWFAKSKSKLNQTDDAIRAIKAYLLNNRSNRLQTLLNKIKNGDTNDN